MKSKIAIASVVVIAILCCIALYHGIPAPQNNAAPPEENPPILSDATEKTPQDDNAGDNDIAPPSHEDKLPETEPLQSQMKEQDSAKQETDEETSLSAAEYAKAIAAQEYGEQVYIVTESITDKFNSLITVGFYAPDSGSQSVKLVTYDIHHSNAQWSVTNKIPSGAFDSSNYQIQTTDDGYMILSPITE